MVNGSLRVTWLAQAVADLAVAPDHFTQMSCAHRGAMFVGEAPVIAVRVKAVEDSVEGASSSRL